MLERKNDTFKLQFIRFSIKYYCLSDMNTT